MSSGPEDPNTQTSLLTTLPPELLYQIITFLDYSSLIKLLKASPYALTLMATPNNLLKTLRRFPFLKTPSTTYCSIANVTYLPSEKEEQALLIRRANLRKIDDITSIIEPLDQPNTPTTKETRGNIIGALASKILEEFSIGAKGNPCPSCHKEAAIETSFSLYWTPPDQSATVFQIHTTTVEGWELLRNLRLELKFLGCGYKLGPDRRLDLLKYDIFHINMIKRRHCDAGLSNGD